MRRFQLKRDPDKDWGDSGPDLLRTRANARKEIKEDLANFDGGWYVRLDKGDGWLKWKGPSSRQEVLENFDDWNPPNKTRAQVGRQANGEYTVYTVVQARVFDVKDYSGCTDHTNQVVALCEAAFPQGAYGGTLVCKTLGSGWSTHAYGKAYDHSCYDDNDKATDWCIRMARQNKQDDIQFPAWQILGSKGGRAGYASNGNHMWTGEFPWHEGGVDATHEWHVHVSTGKTEPTGTPNCASSFAVDQDTTSYASDQEG